MGYLTKIAWMLDTSASVPALFLVVSVATVVVAVLNERKVVPPSVEICMT
jgi:hypothetical protein